MGKIFLSFFFSASVEECHLHESRVLETKPQIHTDHVFRNSLFISVVVYLELVAR